MNKNKLEKISAILIFLISFVVYFLTCSKSLHFTDSGELAAVSSTLGIAHPTGYPLYTILSYLWLKLPLPGSNIEKLNILSAVFVSISVVLFYFILLIFSYNHFFDKSQEKKHIITSAIIALAFGFTSIVWDQATTNEVYSLHFLLVNLFILTLLKAFYSQNYKLFLVSAFVLGLGLTNHLTSILLIPVAIFIFFKKLDKGFDISKNKFKQFLLLFIPFFISLSLYIYLPIRSSMQPLFNWGYVSRSFDKFLYHVSGKQYQVWMFSGFDAWEKNFKVFIQEFVSNIGILILIPFLIGLIYIFNEKNKLKWVFNTVFAPITLFFNAFNKKGGIVFSFLLILFLTCIFYSFNYSIYDIQPYFYTAYFSLFLMLSLPLIYYSEKLFKYSSYFLIIIPLYFVFINYNEVDKKNDEIIVEYTRSIIDNLPKNSIIISAQWDYFCSAFWYLQQIEGYRRDVVMIEKELMRRTWYPYQLAKWYPDVVQMDSPELVAFMRDLELFESEKEYDPISIQANYINFFVSIIEKNINNRAIFLTPDILITEPHIARIYYKIPYGFAVKLSKTNDTINLKEIKIDYNKLNELSRNKTYYLYQGIRKVITNNIYAMINYADNIGDIEAKNELIKYYKMFTEEK